MGMSISPVCLIPMKSLNCGRSWTDYRQSQNLMIETKRLKMATSSSTKSSTTRLIATPAYLQFLDKSPVFQVAEAAHGEDCHCIGMHSWLTGPGRPDQGLHTDWLPISLPADVRSDPRVKIPIFITTAHYYLNNMYEELGPTKFVPGSHFSGCSPNGATEWNNRGEESILCNAGDVVLFRSEVWHRGSANTSDRDPLPLAGALCQSDDYPEIPTLSEQVSV